MLDPQGWVDVDVLLRALNDQGFTVDRGMLDIVVATNNKKRFEYSPDGMRIRARQGHSIPVDLGYTPKEPPEWLYHGTSVESFPTIRKHGLHKMDRHAVHMCSDTETARSVGSRHGKPVVLIVCALAMHRTTGAQFFETDNGVWLTDTVPAGFLVFPCSDCHAGIDRGYMVRDLVWLFVAGVEETLHAECLEKRLGRKLVPADFTDVPINYINEWLPRSHTWEPA